MIAAEAAPIAAAAGPWVGDVLGRVEERLASVAAACGAALAPWASSTIAAGGKRLRPLLVLVAAGAEPASRAELDALVRCAVAVELVHAATLVHDDVLDAADLRRGQPTVVAAAGRDTAVRTGDALFAAAFAELARNGSLAQARALSRASSGLALGELLQRADAWNAEVPLERYLHRCELKTARLFEAACALGRGDDALVPFGRGIGVAFQLLDDVLDVSGPASRTGKHRGTDLLDGTVTLPFILARERSPELAAIDPRSLRTPEDAERVCDAIAATGALDESRARALALVDGARASLPAGLPPAQHAALELVARGVVQRYA